MRPGSRPLYRCDDDGHDATIDDDDGDDGDDDGNGDVQRPQDAGGQSTGPSRNLIESFIPPDSISTTKSKKEAVRQARDYGDLEQEIIVTCHFFPCSGG